MFPDLMQYAFLALLVVLVVVAIVYLKKHPAAEAIVKADVQALGAKLEALVASIKAHTAAVAPPAPVATADPAPIIVGKEGTPGVLAIAVTGDAAADMAAFTAAYFAKG